MKTSKKFMDIRQSKNNTQNKKSADISALFLCRNAIFLILYYKTSLETIAALFLVCFKFIVQKLHCFYLKDLNLLGKLATKIFFYFCFLYSKIIYICVTYLSKMFSFSYFECNFQSENDRYIAFWKCNEKIKVSPFSILPKLQLFSKLHVVYLQILQ
jgi:hypothetical protein